MCVVGARLWTLAVFLHDLLGFAFLLSDARIQRGLLAWSVTCARQGHSAGPPVLSPSASPLCRPVTEAPSAPCLAREEPRLGRAERAAAVGRVGPDARRLPRHWLPDPLHLGLGSWSLSSWSTLLSRLCQSSLATGHLVLIGRGDPLLTTDPPQSCGCLLPPPWGLGQSLRPICSPSTELLQPCLAPSWPRPAEQSPDSTQGQLLTRAANPQFPEKVREGHRVPWIQLSARGWIPSAPLARGSPAVCVA